MCKLRPTAFIKSDLNWLNYNTDKMEILGGGVVMTWLRHCYDLVSCTHFYIKLYYFFQQLDRTYTGLQTLGAETVCFKFLSFCFCFLFTDYSQSFTLTKRCVCFRSLMWSFTGTLLGMIISLSHAHPKWLTECPAPYQAPH